jgi:hypothetical protein
VKYNNNNNNNVFRLEEVSTNRPRDLVTHTDQSDELSDKQRNCTTQFECSTDSNKMRYTTQISELLQQKRGNADCLQIVTNLAKRYQKLPQFAHS